MAFDNPNLIWYYDGHHILLLYLTLYIFYISLFYICDIYEMKFYTQVVKNTFVIYIQNHNKNLSQAFRKRSFEILAFLITQLFVLCVLFVVKCFFFNIQKKNGIINNRFRISIQTEDKLENFLINNKKNLQFLKFI